MSYSDRWPNCKRLNRPNKIQFEKIQSTMCDNGMKTKAKKKLKKQQILNRLATGAVHCLPKWLKQLRNCCNLKHINPKAIYYMVIALQSISINTSQQTKITSIISNHTHKLTAPGLRCVLPRQLRCHQSVCLLRSVWFDVVLCNLGVFQSIIFRETLF